jgi:hypothetical protein
VRECLKSSSVFVSVSSIPFTCAVAGKVLWVLSTSPSKAAKEGLSNFWDRSSYSHYAYMSEGQMTIVA